MSVPQTPRVIPPESRRLRGFTTPVVIGMIDGTTKRGRIKTFSPAVPNILFEERSSSGEESEKTQIPAERIAYIAFLKNAATPINEEPTGTLSELRIHVVGGRSFTVSVDAEKIDHPVGFYSYPTEPNTEFQEVYFYATGINAKESTATLGEMLVAEGTLDVADLNRGVANLARERKVPVGQILLQHDKVSPDQLEEAQELQARKKLRIGEVLVELGLVSNEDIGKALEEQRKRRGKRLGEVLVDLGIIQESALYRTLARKFHIPFVDLDEIVIDPNAAEGVKRDVIEKYGILPLEVRNDGLTIAIYDPLQTDVYDVLRFEGHLRIREVLVAPAQLKRYVQDFLGKGSESEVHEVDAILEALQAESADQGVGQLDESQVKESDSAVVRLANQIIIDAYRHGASDIHVEPNGREQNTLVRFRADGHCSIYQAIPAAFRASLVARIKIMAKLDIAEKRKPQDGKIKFAIGDKQIELRVATIPTVNENEDVVMRILAASKPIPLDQMGMNDRNLRMFEEVISKPYGLVLCVGPTGSGKTTTLHSALGHINRVERKIWTAEDPVEITQAGLRQVQVKPKIGFTFATAMRAFLRADPDVIMIGEMRDHETAAIAVEASLTGHLVFSTLHTNTAPETVTRLLDMGLDSFTFADAMQGVLAQRLTRALCMTCRKPYEADESEFEQVRQSYGEDAMKRHLGITKQSDLRLWKAPGCPACRNTGLKGRLAIHELLVATDDIRAAIQSKATAAEIRRRAIAEGMTTLLQDGVAKALGGKTTLKQVLAVCSR